MTPLLCRDIETARQLFAPSALAIGNFDGVHVGHLTLLREAITLAQANGFVPSVLTFDPHPTAVVAPQRTPPMICTLDERIRLIFAAGVEQILVLPFTHEIAHLSPLGFVSQILVNSLKTKAVVVGENFRFGHRQTGNPAVLRQLGTKLGFESQFLPPVVVRGETVSSSAIRRDLSAGKVFRAARLLGRCFSLAGPVISGQGIGSKQTVPTLNIRPVPGLVCPSGVFVTETEDRLSGRRWPSITNVGVRPTFGGDDVTIETYLLAPLNGPAPEDIEVRFHHFVRFERKFPSPDLLRAQILRDVSCAQAYWRRVANFRTSAASIY